MARIRSIHPGLWTDEAFVCASMAARLLFIGIWNECDDMGSFEWSPVKLKMRLLPADGVDTSELLAELQANMCIQRYEIDGKSYGAVRNFCRFQRPKKPNCTYPQTNEVRNWCGNDARSNRDGSGAVGNQLPTGPENSRQMEEGGDKMEEGGEKREEAGARAKRPPAEPYLFDGRVVRLVRKDFETWRRTYHAIPDITAELTSIDAWLSNQSEEKRRGWFHSASGMLNRKHQELLTSAKANGRAVTGELEMPIA